MIRAKSFWTALAVACWLTSMAPAADSIWNAGTGGWSTPGNWLNQEPTYAFDAVIDNGGTAQVTTGNYEYANALFLGNTAGYSGHVSMTGGYLYVEHDQNIGYHGTGTFTQSGGENRCSAGTSNFDLYLGYYSGSSGTYTMTNGTLYAGDQYIGRLGAGTFLQSGGTNHISATGSGISDHMYIGYATSSAVGNGTYRLSGTGSLVLDHKNAKIYVGYESSSYGVGRFEWFREGNVTWTDPSGSGEMVIGTNGTLAIGYDFSSMPDRVSGIQNGTLEVTNGKTVTKNDAITSMVNYLRFGSPTGAGYGDMSSGTVQVGQAAYVGDGGTGATVQTGGAFNVTTHLYLGTNGAQGTYRLKGGQLNVGGSIYGGTGTGTLILDGGALSVGGSYLNATNLTLGDETGRSGSYTLAAGKTMNVTNLRVGNSGTGTFAQSGGASNVANLTIGAGSYTMTGGTLAVSGPAVVGQGGSGTLNIGAQNPSVGSLTLRNGTVSGSGTITATSPYTMESGTASARLAGNVSLTKQTSGTVTLGNSGNSYGGTTYINGGKLIVPANGCLGTQYGHVDFDTGTLRTTASFETSRDMAISAGGGTFEVDSGTTLTHHGGIDGTGSLTKTGSGILYLYTTSNSWGGGTYINGGELWTGNSSVIPNNLVSISAATLNLKSHTEGIGALSLSSGVVAASGGTLSLGGSVTSTGTSSIGDAVTLGGHRTFNVTSGTLTVGGAVSGSGQTVTLSGAGNAKILMSAAGTSNADYSLVPGGGRMLGGANTTGTAQFTGNITLNKEVTLTAADGGKADFNTGTWATNNNAVTVTGAGASVVQISNTLNTTGTVSVNSGALWVNGSLGGGGSSLTVAGGATLGGTGTIGKPVVVSGNLNPGNSPGVLTVNDNLTLGGTSMLELQAHRPEGPGDSYYDGIVIGGTGHTLTFGGTLNVVNFSGGPTYVAGQEYKLFDWGTNTTAGTFSFVNLPALGGGLQWKMFGSQRFDYTTGEIVVENGATTTHYALGVETSPSLRNVLLQGNVGLTSRITNTGSGSMDTLDFTGLAATSSPGGSVSGPGADGSDVPLGETRYNPALTFRGASYSPSVVVTPTIATATNHNLGGPAILDSTLPVTVNVGMADAGPGKDRLAFGPPLVGQGAPKHGPVGPERDYRGLASKTTASTWEEDLVVLGTEATILEGIDTSANHLVSMEWRQRYDGTVHGEPGSEIPETTLLFSDVARLTGMDLLPGNPWPEDRHESDVFALQMSFVDPEDYPDKLHGLAYLDLGDDHRVGGTGTAADAWIEAALGNRGGSPQRPVHQSWDQFRAEHPGKLLDLLGYCGWEGDGSGRGQAWAVIDYNNVQVAVVPEPGTLALLAAAVAALAVWRRRRGRSCDRFGRCG